MSTIQRLSAKRRAVPIVLALIVAATTGFIAYLTWEAATFRHLVAAFVRHPPPRGADVERALGVLQAVAGTALVIFGVLGRRSARPSYVAWVITLLALVIAFGVDGMYFESVLDAAPFIAGAALAVGAGWRLTERRAAAS